MQIYELMTKNPVSVAPDAPVAQVFRLQVEMSIRHVPVVDDGELLGMVSDRDLRDLSVDELAAMDNMDALRARLNTPVSELMSGDVLKVYPDDNVSGAIELMLEHRVGALPVVSAEGQLVGIVSTVDVLRELHGRL